MPVGEPAPGRPGSVVETHVSILVFHDDVVLKLKKPVRFPFVDLTSAAARQAACQAEIEANRRLSPDVYLGVAELRLADRILEHAVVMRRLPAERNLAALVAAGRVDPDRDLRPLARVLAAFHARATRSAAIDHAARARSVARTWRQCLDTLAAFAGRVLDAEAIERVDELASTFLEGRRALFDQRIAEGRVCDGHGDLLASDIFLLDDGPRVLDCVEFDPTMRHVDAASDIAFLLMDLEHRGAPQTARTFLELYRDASADPLPAALVHHYCALRAAIRAEVACLRTDQGAPGTDEEARALLALALDHLHAGRVVLGVICGPPGSGKSTVARGAGELLGWPVLRADEIRRELFAPGEVQLPTEPLWGPVHSPAATARTYQTMLDRARVALEHGQSVLLDATFADRHSQDEAERLARATASELVVVACTAPAELAAARAGDRRRTGTDVSGAGEQVARAVAAAAAPWPRAVPVDTGERPVADSVREAVAVLRDELVVAGTTPSSSR